MQLNYISYTPAEGIIYHLQTDALLPATRRKQKRTQPHAGTARTRGLASPRASPTGQELLPTALAFPCKASAPGALLASRFLRVPGVRISMYNPTCRSKLIFARAQVLGLLPTAPGRVFFAAAWMLAAPHWLESFALELGCWTVQLFDVLNVRLLGAGTISWTNFAFSSSPTHQSKTQPPRD